MKYKYRVIRDLKHRYHAQFKRSWLPFWEDCDYPCHYGDVETALQVCQDHAEPFVLLYTPVPNTTSPTGYEFPQ